MTASHKIRPINLGQHDAVLGIRRAGAFGRHVMTSATAELRVLSVCDVCDRISDWPAQPFGFIRVYASVGVAGPAANTPTPPGWPSGSSCDLLETVA